MIAKCLVNSVRRRAAAPPRRRSSTTDAPRPARRRRWPVVVAVLAGAVTLAACAAFETVDYYWQGATGQWDLIARSRPIPDVIGSSDEALAERLRRVHEIRTVASRELGLPDNGSYTRYTDLGRAFVTWNVFATPELSMMSSPERSTITRGRFSSTSWSIVGISSGAVSTSSEPPMRSVEVSAWSVR